MTDPTGDELASTIAAAVLGVDGVVALSAGQLGQFRTYLPGGRSVAGVRIDDAEVTVDVTARYGPNLPDLGQRVAEALTGLVGGRSVVVEIDDLVLPDDVPGNATADLTHSNGGP